MEFESYFKELYNYREMNNTLKYWKEMNALESVANLKPALAEINANYEKDMASLAEQTQTEYEKFNSRYLKNKKLKEQWKKSVLGSIIVCVVLYIIERNVASTLLNIFSALVFFAVVISVAIFGLLYLIEEQSTKKYRSYVANLQLKANTIYDKHSKQATQLYKRIDSIYLESLDPMQRELILTKREIKATTDQMASMQKQMTNENRILRNKLDEAQSKMVSMQRDVADTNEKMKKMSEKLHLDV